PVAEPDSEAKRQKLQNQFEFYFSKDNLCGDVYLRQHMDEEGFVSVPFMSTTFNKRSGKSLPIFLTPICSI
uniref:HTH La-type RNA-binding domain-containing protein n=1 Tax=Aegilops tauschii subsp. strangulata TaxID=200361 RepID=A0A453MKB6_AEGTS